MLYRRYIDDIFIIWESKHNDLKNFLEYLNKKHPTIKFDFNVWKDVISVLDTKVNIDKNRYLQTTIYLKETDRQSSKTHQVLTPTLIKLKYSISQQAPRIKRICSTVSQFQQ